MSRRLEALRAELGVQPPGDPDHAPTRIRGLPPVPPPGPASAPAWAPVAVEPSPVVDTPAIVEVPVPGRHASRRVRTRPSLPDLPDLRVTTSHVKVVAVLCAVALAGAVWAMTTGRGEEPQPVAPAPAAAPLAATPLGTTAASPASSAPQPTGDVTVDVAGKVRRPQIIVLPAGSRVADAIAAAGGARRGVDLTPINLARVLVDGEQVVVGLPHPVADVQSPPSSGGSDMGQPGALVNINTADQALLETLPGVGPVTATSIIAWRTDNAGFSSVSELLEVDGIGDATLARLTPLVTV